MRVKMVTLHRLVATKEGRAAMYSALNRVRGLKAAQQMTAEERTARARKAGLVGTVIYWRATKDGPRTEGGAGEQSKDRSTKGGEIMDTKKLFDETVEAIRGQAAMVAAAAEEARKKQDYETWSKKQREDEELTGAKTTDLVAGLCRDKKIDPEDMHLILCNVERVGWHDRQDWLEHYARHCRDCEEAEAEKPED
jgi:hypothetical protein